MRILISHPYYWPYVRRGSERYIHELSDYLSRRNYAISIVTSKPGLSKTQFEGKVRVCYWREHQGPILRRYGVTPTLSFAPSALYSFMKEKYDLIHSFFYSDGFAAHLCKKVKSIRYVLNFNGVPIASFFRKLPLHNYLIKKAFDSASAIIVSSEFARQYLWEDYRKEGVVVPGAVDLSKYYIEKDKDLERPSILCTASINQPYKNVPLLVKAFEQFKAKVPKAVLKLSGHAEPAVARELINSVDPKIKNSIHILGTGRVNDLPRLYAEAALCVLPSINEAFGAVLIEALASGTPVVGSASGGIPEIISDPKIGSLYQPDRMDALPTNSGDLCDAMMQAYELAKDSDTAQRCREHVKPYDWSTVGSKFEAVYGMAA